MTRAGFLGALLGVPFVAGWVKKIDSSGHCEVAVLEPHIMSSWPIQNCDSHASITTTADVTFASTGTATYAIGVPWTYTRG